MTPPRFSVVTPVYNPPADALREMIESVRRQTNPDWELCLADDCSTEPHVRPILEEAAAADGRIKVSYAETNGGIVAASNLALASAEGEFIALLDHDDRFHPDALLHVAAALDANPAVDYVYTDEDKIDAAGHHSGPFFKPDWSPERMRAQMYTCHLSVLRRELVEEVGGFDAEFEGSQDWDLVLKVTERARAVAHVPRILYHWRMLAASTASDSAAKPWAYEAGKRAVQAHCDRIGFPAEIAIDEVDPGVLHVEPRLRDEPLVSIVIPTAGQEREVRFEHVVLVVNCVRSIVTESTYTNYEIVVVVDEDTDPEILAELDRIAGDRLRLVEFEGEFNFSAKINLGAAHSRGDHLLLLNDDIEITTPNWLERMVMYSAWEGVGAVGGRLLWGDGRLQHVGITLQGGLPGHIYRGYEGATVGYVNAIRVARNCMAVTGACLMTPRTVFEELGGLSETFPVNFNDVDYCLKVHDSGRRIVYDADLVLVHYESSTRDPDVNDWEVYQLLDRWSGVAGADPFDNPNLRHGVPRLTSFFAWARRGRPAMKADVRARIESLASRR